MSADNQENDNQLQLFNEKNVERRVPYKVLSEYHKKSGEFVSGETLREKYVHQTDELFWELEGGRENKSADVVIYLDKSARPVAWFAKELWPIVHPDTKIPQPMFLNIDRDQWRPYLGEGLAAGFSEPFNYNGIPPSVYSSLRSVFVENPRQLESAADADNMPTLLDGKEVVIVDEVRSTGHTLEIATEMLRRALPEAHFRGFHWMTPELITRKGMSMNNEVPIWYNSTDVRGRGVGNRDHNLSLGSISKRQQLGSWFLSTRLNEPDEKSVQLRQEIHQIAKDVEAHKILYLPSLQRDIDDMDEIIERVNGMSLQEFTTKRRQRN